jgi:hypothetical protein
MMATRALKTELEAWRPALIAFYRQESPWMLQTLEDLTLGRPFTDDNIRVIRGLQAAVRLAA